MTQADIDAEHRFTVLEQYQKSTLDKLDSIGNALQTGLVDHFKEDDVRFSALDAYASDNSKTLARMESNLQNLTNQVSKLTGKLEAYEIWRTDHDLHHKHQDGFLAGINWVVLTTVAIAAAIGGFIAVILS